MSSSGTASFTPAVYEIVLLAYSRCKVRRNEIKPEHLADARMEINLLFSEWENEQPHLWKIDLQTINLVGGQAAYVLPSDTVLLTDAYYRVNSGTPSIGGWGTVGWGKNGWGNTMVPGAGITPTDRILWGVSRSEYAAYPDKTRQSQCTVYWFERLNPPVLTFYPTPFAGTTDQVLYYRVARIQDAFAAGPQTPDVVNRYMAALADGLTANLSMTYAPDQATTRMQKYLRTLRAARVQDRENVPLRVVPAVGAYFRGAC